MGRRQRPVERPIPCRRDDVGIELEGRVGPEGGIELEGRVGPERDVRKVGAVAEAVVLVLFGSRKAAKH